MAMVTTERNRAIALGALDDWRAGRTPITDMFAADMRWRIEGRSLVATVFFEAKAFDKLWTRVEGVVR